MGANKNLHNFSKKYSSGHKTISRRVTKLTSKKSRIF